MTFAVHAVRFAGRPGVRGQHFLGHDDRSGEPHPTAYSVWLARSETHTVLVDAGIDPARPVPIDGITFRCSPVDGLAALGVRPQDVDLVVLTHLHYDHTGTVAALPSARYVVQRAELDYWTGPVAARIRREHWLVSREDLAHLTGPARERLDVVDGSTEVVPGIEVHHVGGHTAGMQVVRVRTAAGPVVLASDAAHFHENLTADRPPPILHSVPGVHAAFDRLVELAGPDGLIVPGHDPDVPAGDSPGDVVVRVA
ncbi:N-acyl homoserine lactonase family protein [Actinomycetospora aeridis]|uniref:N-acyl homoserine lactonase family protein n=1 Tax=Actinomycetospora aeridis TaxID=3129231 RepID=A0ABU8N5P9_9PSEU